MNPFMQKLASSAGDAPLGTFIMSASPLVAEAIGCCGFDWAIVDAEHSPLDTMDVAYMLQALGTTPTVPILRVPWNDAVIVKRVLDAGASTLLFPFIQTPEEAARAVQSTRYPPDGIRGMAGLTRASRFGAMPDHFRTANSRIGVIVQLETPAAMERLEDIAAVNGVDALFVGPSDLSGAMGHAGNAGHPQVQQMVLEAARRCNAAGKPIGTVAGTTELAAQYRDAGFGFVAIASDLAFITGQARSALARLRDRSAGSNAILGGSTH